MCYTIRSREKHKVTWHCQKWRRTSPTRVRKAGGVWGGQLQKDCRRDLVAVGCGRGRSGCNRWEREVAEASHFQLSHVALFSLLHSQEAATEGNFSVSIPCPLGRFQRDFLIHASCNSPGSDHIQYEDNRSLSWKGRVVSANPVTPIREMRDQPDCPQETG